ncbi:SEC-C domain-containing protein [Phyllobacterium zundukense]|uniref:SEC-C domain-containing protein n=1 Tax=Phyllobacterium zundukense TaxID=1867719 RepID=A0ACD4D3J5_9HYPH|nr:SEC-C domain-containing protein [Phyllobacterium zundukense]UXN60487.1 SEC-C domain-containing protein [Phyllobacterium zundukense]
MKPGEPRSTRIARSAPCPCGSGKKYKHCHGQIRKPELPEDMKEQIARMLRQREAQEIVRKRQQGHGKRIISAEFQGQRVVAVGNRIVFSPKWTFFTDFLLSYLPEVMGRDWGAQAKKHGLKHPLFGWMDKFTAHSKQHDTSKGAPAVGFVTGIFQFAYALYLMEHHDQLPKSLIGRLRQPDHFQPAVYETVVAAAFALAGAKIEDAQAKSDKAPEFWATMKSGRKYAVEAKRKNSWKNAYDLNSDVFRSELRSWLRNKVHAASEKKLSNAVYWFELSIGTNFSEADLPPLYALIQQYVREAELMTVGKQSKEKPVPTYVFVTNHPYFANDDVKEVKRLIFLDGYRMDDFRSEDLVSLEEAMERRDKHKDMIWVYQCFMEVETVPSTFDGTPPGLSGVSESLQIGKKLDYNLPDGTPAQGTIYDIVAFGDSATVAIKDEITKASHIVRVPLSSEEAKAAAIYGNAAFGKPEGPTRNYGGDILGLYDRFLEIYADYPRESLLLQIRGHPDYKTFVKLDDDALRIRVAREITKSATAQHNPTCE